MKSIIKQFEIICEKYPEKISVRFYDNYITFKELKVLSDLLALTLIKEIYFKSDYKFDNTSNTNKQKVITILMDKSQYIPAIIMGILKSGNIFLPVDPLYPEDRIKYCINNSKSNIIVTTKKYEFILKKYGMLNDKYKIIFYEKIIDYNKILNKEFIKTNEFSSKDPEKDNYKYTPFFNKDIQDKFNKVKNNINKDDIAYIIYTSGSTGNPKGVLIPHKNIVNLVNAQKKIFNITFNDTISHMASISFDASIWEIMPALLTGATLVVVNRNLILNINNFVDYINQNNVTILTSGPSYLINLNPDDFKTLRIVISAGEQCQKNLALKWSKKFEFYNAYGPTETTVCATVFKVNYNEIKDYEVIPIGKPIDGVNCYVLNNKLEACPTDQWGELYVGGKGVGAGYINNEELTKKRFLKVYLLKNSDGNVYFKLKDFDLDSKEDFDQSVENSINNPDNNFNNSKITPKIDRNVGYDYIYKTGDIVKYDKKGNLIFKGREDFQIKLRGYRIELGEIENSLIQHPLIENSSVIVYKNYHLVVFYKTKENIKVSPKTIKSFLSKLLPYFMIPSFYFQINEFPLTINGKISRKRLLEMANDLIKKNRIIENEKNNKLNLNNLSLKEIEQNLKKIFINILELNNIKITDDFFDIGGDSLNAIRLITEIDKVFFNNQNTITYDNIFQLRNIKNISEYIYKCLNIKNFKQNNDNNKIKFIIFPSFLIKPIFHLFKFLNKFILNITKTQFTNILGGLQKTYIRRNPDNFYILFEFDLKIKKQEIIKNIRTLIQNNPVFFSIIDKNDIKKSNYIFKIKNKFNYKIPIFSLKKIKDKDKIKNIINKFKSLKFNKNFNSPLFDCALFFLSDTTKIIFRINHFIADKNCFNIIKTYLTKPYNINNTYFNYINSVEKEIDNKLLNLKQFEIYTKYKEAIANLLANQDYKNILQNKIINYHKITFSNKISTEEVYAMIFDYLNKILFYNINIKFIPIRILTSRRILNSKNYFSTIGDMHDFSLILLDKNDNFESIMSKKKVFDEFLQKNEINLTFIKYYDNEIYKLFKKNIIINILDNIQENELKKVVNPNQTSLSFSIGILSNENSIGIVANKNIKFI